MTVEIEGLRPLADGFAFTECPRWVDGWLYFSDMYGATIHRVDEAGTVEDVVREEARPGGSGFTADGSLLFAAMDASQVKRLRDGEVTLHADLAAIAPDGINDMIVGPHGHCYIAHFTHMMPPPSRPLIVLDPDGHAGETDDLLKVANGMVLTADGKRLIVAESAGGRLSVFDLDDAGQPRGRQTFAELPPGHFADGICGDADGGVWVTCCRGPGVVRVEEGGTITHRLTIGDDRFAYACALGGSDGRTLFVCTAGRYQQGGHGETRDSRIEIVRVPFAQAGIP